MPTSPAFTNSDWGISRTVAVSESPFTGASQVHSYPKAQWQATLTLPPMKRSQASQWQAFFMQCEGRANTFLLGDPDGKEIISDAAPTSIAVASSAAIGDTTVNLTIGAGKQINTGSYLQFFTGANSVLHMVVDNNSGDGSVTIQPPLKVALTTSTPVDFTEAQGVFRMDSNDLRWSADQVSRYGITFSCSEVI